MHPYTYVESLTIATCLFVFILFVQYYTKTVFCGIQTKNVRGQSVHGEH